HISKKQQKKRLKDAHEKAEAPYKRFVAVSEAFLRRTSTGEAPWIVVPGGDRRYRAVIFGRHLAGALEEHLQGRANPVRASRTLPTVAPADGLNLLRALKLDRPMTEAQYDKRLEREQARLAELSRSRRFREMAVVALFEGNDAAGKGGAIRRVTQAL